uniref:Linker for activation of T cells n=1 Tax=Canis lupus dingo TaxID=286419 RepID=A0A8C0KE33_CANLU
MNVESELLWPGVALLLLLGTVAGLCVRCSRPGKGAVERGPGGAQSVKRLQRPLSFAVVRQAWPGPLVDKDPHVAPTRRWEGRPRGPLWPGSGQDLVATSDLRAPELDCEGPMRGPWGCGSETPKPLPRRALLGPSPPPLLQEGQAAAVLPQPGG